MECVARRECAFCFGTISGQVAAMRASGAADRPTPSRSIFGRAGVAGLVTMLMITLSAATAAPASAGLLGNLLCPVVNTLGRITGAGWDDGATTPPTTMA